MRSFGSRPRGSIRSRLSLSISGVSSRSASAPRSSYRPDSRWNATSSAAVSTLGLSVGSLRRRTDFSLRTSAQAASSRSAYSTRAPPGGRKGRSAARSPSGCAVSSCAVPPSLLRSPAASASRAASRSRMASVSRPSSRASLSWRAVHKKRSRTCSNRRAVLPPSPFSPRTEEATRSRRVRALPRSMARKTLCGSGRFRRRARARSRSKGSARRSVIASLLRGSARRLRMDSASRAARSHAAAAARAAPAISAARPSPTAMVHSRPLRL